MKRQHAPSRLFLFVILICALVIGGCATRHATGGIPDHVTVPMEVDDNRPYITVTFQRPDGSMRSARFLIDTGGGGFFLSEPLARDLGLTWTNVIHENGADYGRATAAPKAFVNKMPLRLDLESEHIFAAVGVDRVAPRASGGRRDGIFPGRVLARYHVIFDYPHKTFTLAQPGLLKPKGNPMPMPVSKGSHFPRTEIVVDGKTYGLLLDTGASFTMVSEELLKAWGAAHPDWPRYPGAYGEAATLGGQTLETMFVPDAKWGPYLFGRFGVTSQRKGTFEDWMSSSMTSPIIGSLAGNVLKYYRLELDYSNQTLYVSKPASK
jgi:predicted aspartyl protease